MRLSEISDLDAKCLKQVRNILKLTVTEMKFSLGDARIVDETIRWFDAFLEAAAFVQKEEAKKKSEITQKPDKKEGLSSVKIKDFNPGSLPIARSGTPAKKSPKRKK